MSDRMQKPRYVWDIYERNERTGSITRIDLGSRGDTPEEVKTDLDWYFRDTNLTLLEIVPYGKKPSADIWKTYQEQLKCAKQS